MTYTQYVVWHKWLETDWRIPPRAERHSMSLRAAVVRGYAKTPRKVRDDEMYPNFPALRRKPKKPEGWVPGMPRPVTKEDIIRINRDRALKTASAARPPARPRRG